jgi:hypothetical protein
MSTNASSGVRRKRTLPEHFLARRIERHPKDGWQRAKPYRMGRRARRALRGLIWAICPPPPAPRFPGFTARIELGVRRILPYMHPLTRLLLTLVVLLLDWTPRLLFKSWRRLHQLPPAQASCILESLERGRWHALRTALAAVRGAILSVYFDQDEVHRALDYAPVPFMTDRVRLRLKLLAPAKVAAG